MNQSPFRLMKKRRFLPFFITQFFGAMNDNVLKNALVVLITFQGLSLAGLSKDILVNLCAACFILPYFLFSATAGQIADKYDKATLIKRIKLCEILIMLIAIFGFYTQNIIVLLSALFLAGTQSAFFGPIKYAIIPQALKKQELMAGNAVVEMGTFLAILLGIILGSKLIGVEHYGAVGVCAMLLIFSVLGYLASRFIPDSAPADANLKMDLNPFTQTLKTLKFTRQNNAVFKSILGVSWFWFFGASVLTQLPNYTRDVLGANDDVYILFLATFSISIALGSFLCERLSGKVVEIGLVPIGSFFMTLFALDWYCASTAFDMPSSVIGVDAFFASKGSFRIILDVMGLGVFSGFFIVPLYAYIQQNTQAKSRSRVISGNNILNALFMVASAIICAVLLSAGLSIPALLLVIGLMNVVIALYIYTLVPEFMVRCLVWVVVNIMYRLKHKGLENIPQEGSALVICNHVSFIDSLVIASCSRRPIRFVMYYKIFETPVLKHFFKTVKAIPIAGHAESPEVKEQAFAQISECLRNGELVGIFPEGQLTSDGEMQAFQKGVEQILSKDPVPVVPMALCGLWGSFFSRKYGSAMTKPFKRFWSRVELRVGAVMPLETVTAEKAYRRVADLLNWSEKE